jgi:hypothetical protein
MVASVDGATPSGLGPRDLALTELRAIDVHRDRWLHTSHQGRFVFKMDDSSCTWAAFTAFDYRLSTIPMFDELVALLCSERPR